jgi:hypothetical protein
VKNKETVDCQIDDPALALAIFPTAPLLHQTHSMGKSRLGQTFFAIPTSIELFTI